MRSKKNITEIEIWVSRDKTNRLKWNPLEFWPEKPLFDEQLGMFSGGGIKDIEAVLEILYPFVPDKHIQTAGWIAKMRLRIELLSFKEKEIETREDSDDFFAWD